MEFGFTPEQDAFRARVREELGRGDIRRELDLLAGSADREPDVRPLYRAIGLQGLLAVNWPSAYGGRDTGLTEAAIVAEELARAGVPDTLHVNTVQIVGLFLQLAGSDTVKRRYLPGLAAGELFASVLYTEPEAGSDLASLRTTATPEPDGSGYRLDGVKTYNLKSDITDVALCAARTGAPDGRYQGITLFMVDLHAEGVRRESVPGIADEQFHRVVLDGVRVPADDVVGEPGEGWALLTGALAIERTGLDYSLKAERWYVAALADGCRGEELERAGRHGAAVEASRLQAWQVIRQLAQGLETADENTAAIAKYVTSELARSIARWSVTLPQPEGAAAARARDAAYREAPGLAFSAGTSEVMLQIVAAAGPEPGAAAWESAEDLLSRQVRQTLRKMLTEAVEGRDRDQDPASAVHGAPAEEGPLCPGWSGLVAIGAPAFEVSAEADGLDLGLMSSLVVCEELGRAGLSGPYKAGALTADALRVLCPDAPELRRIATGELTVRTDDFGGRRPGPARGATHVLRTTPALTLTAVDPYDDCAGDGDCGCAEEREQGDLGGGHLDGPGGLGLGPGPGLGLGWPDTLQWEGIVARARIRQAAHLLGIAEGAYAAAYAYTTGRSQFGRPLHDFQAVSFALARAAAGLETVRAAVYRAGFLADDGRSAVRAGADALALAAEAALDTTATAVHVCGVRGLTADLTVQRYYRLAHTEAVRLCTPARLFRETARLRLSARGDLDLLTLTPRTQGAPR